MGICVVMLHRRDKKSDVAGTIVWSKAILTTYIGAAAFNGRMSFPRRIATNFTVTVFFLSNVLKMQPIFLFSLLRVLST